MNLSFALPKSPESPAAGGALEGRNARKTEGSQARDGFSEMLDQLASFIPANAEGDGALPDRQAQDLPGGKELPVDAAGLPVVPDDASGTPLGVPQLAVTLETGVVPETGSRAAPGNAPGTPSALHTPAGTNVAASPAQGGGLEVRISAAQAPQDGRLAAAGSAVQNGMAAITLPGAAAEAAASAEAATTVTAKVETAAAQVGDRAALGAPGAMRSDGGDKPSSEEGGKPAEDNALADKGKLRAMALTDTAKPAAQGIAALSDESAASVRPVAAAPRPIAGDQFANVERVVEHLMAARQVDLTKSAAIAVAHREFGQLTVTFDQSAGGMNVEIAAQDGETQRALAAAMANERPSARQPEAFTQAAQAGNQPAANGERGAGGNAAGSGTGQADAEQQRSQQSDQRGRRDGGSAGHSNPQAQPPSSDDALYA